MSLTLAISTHSPRLKGHKKLCSHSCPLSVHELQLRQKGECSIQTAVRCHCQASPNLSFLVRCYPCCPNSTQTFSGDQPLQALRSQMYAATPSLASDTFPHLLSPCHNSNCRKALPHGFKSQGQSRGQGNHVLPSCVRIFTPGLQSR